MAILDVKRDRVVPIPSVEDCLAMVEWDGAGLMKRGLCVVGFPRCMAVQGLKINGAP